jgi:hypothetical protein
MHERLGLLVVPVTIVLGACAGDDGDSGTAGSPGTEPGQSSSADTMAGDDASGPGDASSRGTTTDDGDNASDSFPVPDDTTDDGPIPEDTTDDGTFECTPEPIPPICETAAERWIECIYDGNGPTEVFASDCSCRLQLGAEMYGRDCVSVLEDFYACLAQSDCMAIVLDEYCDRAISAIGDVCPGLSPQ